MNIRKGSNIIHNDNYIDTKMDTQKTAVISNGYLIGGADYHECILKGEGLYVVFQNDDSKEKDKRMLHEK